MKIKGIAAGLLIGLSVTASAGVIDTSTIRASIIKAGVVASGVIGNPFGGAVADFFTLNFNLGTIVPETTETITTSFTRATPSSVTTVDGREGVQINSGEVPFVGHDRIENGITASEDLSDAVWIKDSLGNGSTPVQVSGNTYTFATGGTASSDRSTIRQDYSSSIPVGQQVTLSFTASADAGVTLSVFAHGSSFENIPITTTPRRYSVAAQTIAADATVYFRLYGDVAGNVTRNITITDIQIEDVTGKPNKAPGQYTSVGVLSAPYHGANVDGVRSSPYHNPRYVDSNNVVQNDSETGELITAANSAFINVQAAGDYYSKASPTITAIDGLTVKIKVAPEDVVSGSAQRLLEIPTSGRDQVLQLSATGHPSWSDGTASAAATTLPSWSDGSVTWLVFVINETAETVSFYQAFTFGEPEVADYVTLTANVSMSASPSSGTISSISAPSATSPAIGRYYNAVLSEGANTDTLLPSSLTGWSANGNAYTYTPVERAIRISEADTNTFTYSEDFSNAAWTKGNSTTGTATFAGGYNLDALVDDSSTGTGAVTFTQAITVAGGGDSIKIRAKAKRLGFIYITTANFDAGANGTSWVNLNTGASGTTSANHTVTPTRIADGVVEIEVEFSSTTDLTGDVIVGVADADNDTTVDLDGTSDIYAGAIQHGSGPYVKTVASAVARNADVETNSGFTLTTTSGHIELTDMEAVSGETYLRIDDGSSNNYIRVYMNASSEVQLDVYSGGVAQAQVTSTTTFSPGDAVDIAFRVDTNDVALLIDQTVEGTDTSVTLPATMDDVDIGNNAGTVTGEHSTAKVMLYDTAQSNAALGAL